MADRMMGRRELARKTMLMMMMTVMISGGLRVIGLPGVEAETQENIYASGCSGDEIILQCPQDNRIAVKRLFFGVKKSWDCQQGANSNAECCHAAHTDCLINDDTKYPTLNTHCSGYRRCKIQVQRVPATAHCPGAAHTDYMTVIYDCVPEEDIATFCSDDIKRGKSLYLANEEYPSSVQGVKADCTCMVRTRPSGLGAPVHRGLNVHSIDVLLAWAEHGARSCSKELAIRDDEDYRWNIQCGHLGYYGFRTIYTRPVDNVTLTFTSSASKGSAFVWLQAKATDENVDIQIICGEPLRQILFRSKQEVESRHRNDEEKQNGNTTTTDRGRTRNSTYPYSAHIESLSSSLAAIIGGIVGAGFILISIVIIALAFHCKRVQLARQKRKQTLNLYPAVSKSEEESVLASYCRYNDYDDDHYSSISRSPLKMSSLTDSDIATTHARTNGFVTLGMMEREAHAKRMREEEEQKKQQELHAQTLPHNYSHQHHPTARDSLLSDPGYQSRYQRWPIGLPHDADVYSHEGQGHHMTLPEGRSHRVVVSGSLGMPKSPVLGKRSKSVSFSQPVAMVTPLPSGSEESVGDQDEEVFCKESSPASSLEDGSYDNLHKVVIPDTPLSPSQMQMPPMPPPPQRPTTLQGYPENYPKNYPGSPQQYLPTADHTTPTFSLPRSLSTFSSQEGYGQEAGLQDFEDDADLPPPPPPIVMNGDMYAVVHKKPPLPLPPSARKHQVHETGV